MCSLVTVLVINYNVLVILNKTYNVKKSHFVTKNKSPKMLLKYDN